MSTCVCRGCKRSLTSASSVARGIGPKCAKNEAAKKASATARQLDLFQSPAKPADTRATNVAGIQSMLSTYSATIASLTTQALAAKTSIQYLETNGCGQSPVARELRAQIDDLQARFVVGTGLVEHYGNALVKVLGGDQ